MGEDESYPFVTTGAGGQPQFDNEFQVAKAVVVDLRTLPQPQSEFVVAIATKNCPNASPFHFRFEEKRLRELVESVSEYLDSR